MELEVVRSVADWLNGVTAGSSAWSLNTLLPLVPRDAGDAAPPLVTCYDATRDEWVARRTVPNDAAVTLPAIAVFLAAPSTLDGEVHTIVRDAQFSVGIAYFLDQSDLTASLVHSFYTKRAIVRSLKQLNDPANTGSGRTRNSVVVRVCRSIRLAESVARWGSGQDAGDSWLATAVIADFDVRDLAP